MTSTADLPLPLDLPSAMFTGPGLLTLADLIPVMTAFVDRHLRYRFMNKPLAEWFERPRREMIGKHMREVLGEAAFADREEMLRAALAGERKLFAATFEHPTRGVLAAQTDYVPWINPATGEVDGIVIVLTDVTEQRLAEGDRSGRAKSGSGASPTRRQAMMWVTPARSGTRDFVNDAYLEFSLGPDGDREDARLLDWRSRIHPEDIDRIVAKSIAGEASLQRFTLEGRYLRHDGEYRWLRTVSQPRFGPNGELVGFIGVGTDITLAKEAELELRRQVDAQTAQLAASEAQFRAVFEAALEVMVLLEPDGTVIAVNNRREVWRNEDPREALGKKLWDDRRWRLTRSTSR